MQLYKKELETVWIKNKGNHVLNPFHLLGWWIFGCTIED
jgi:hypothetical protein